MTSIVAATLGPIIALDVWLENVFLAIRDERLMQIFSSITLLAHVYTVLIATLLLTVILWWKKRYGHIATLWIALLSNESAVAIGKFFIHRPRPSGSFSALMDTSSFPSGHAARAAVFFGFLAYIAIRECRSRNVKASALTGMFFVILLVDLSRLTLGVHYLSDVLAGNLLALGILLCVIGVMRRERGEVAERWKRQLGVPEQRPAVAGARRPPGEHGALPR